MANRPRNERQDLLESMYEPDGILLTTDDVVLRRGTRKELRGLLMESGGREIIELLTSISWLPKSESRRFVDDFVGRMCDPGTYSVVDMTGLGVVGSFRVKYPVGAGVPEVVLTMLDPCTSDDRGHVLDILMDILHRLNSDDELEVRCHPHGFPDRAMLESRGAWISRFELRSPLPPEDRQILADSWNDVVDGELEGMAAGFGVSEADLFCGELVYRIPWEARPQDVRNDRIGITGSGTDQVVWWVRDIVMRINAVGELFTSGHPLRGLREVRGLLSMLRNAVRSTAGSGEHEIAEMEREIDRFERDLRDRGEEE